MSDTSLIVESTKGIGELITAEFYGEVMVGSKETIKLNYDTLVTDTKAAIDPIHQNFIEAVKNLKVGVFPNWKKKYRQFEQDQTVLMSEATFDDYWEILKVHTNEDEPHKVLRKIKNDSKWMNESTDDIAKNYVEMRYSVEPSKRRRRQRLVMLGRGWVRAGIDFTNFDENTFEYDASKGMIKLFGNQPRIISASINPWLSPAHGIPGWEIVEVNNKARKNGPELVREVKKAALYKLKQQAEAAEILENALKNAETNLSGFFSLVLDREVAVKIYANVLDAYLDELNAADSINNEELKAAASLIKSHIDDPAIFEFYKNVDLRIREKDAAKMKSKGLPLHYQSMGLRLTENNIRDQTDSIQVSSLDTMNLLPIDFFYTVVQASDSTVQAYSKALEVKSLWNEVYKWYQNKAVPKQKGINEKERRQMEEHIKSLDISKKRQWVKTLRKVIMEEQKDAIEPIDTKSSILVANQ